MDHLYIEIVKALTVISHYLNMGYGQLNLLLFFCLLPLSILVLLLINMRGLKNKVRKLMLLIIEMALYALFVIILANTYDVI